MKHHSISPSSPSPHSLDSLDYQFNGALDENHVRELASAAFIKKGENLLLVGGPGTGKTVIASEICAEASRQSLSVSILLPASTFDECEHQDLLRGAFGLVEDRYGPMGFGPSAVASKPAVMRHSRTEFLDCDVLLVDECTSWLAYAPMQFKYLLARRILLGRSTLLVLGTGEWHWLLSSEAAQIARGISGRQGRMRDVLHCLPFGRGNELLRERLATECTFAETLVTLGVGVVGREVPFGAAESVHAASTHEQQLLQALNLSAFTQRLGNRNVSAHSSGGDFPVTPFRSCPVWHILYTGENSPHFQSSGAELDF